jgi:inhibitor of KinA sporulation pathway (predicted exonuclease)
VFGFDKMVILDTEWTSWPGFMESRWSMPGKYREIVQIGAVKLDARDNFSEIASFEILIKPRINPELSDFFTDLTGITQKEVDMAGVDFPDALSSFVSFVDGDIGMIASFGGDEVIIEENCRLHGIPNPFDPSIFTNIAPLLGRAVGRDELTFMSSDIPKLFDFEPPGQAHRAVDDTRCVAEALRILRQRGEI